EGKCADIAMAVDEGDLYLVWRLLRGEEALLRFARLDGEGHLITDRELSSGLSLPRQNRILVGPDSSLHLFTLARREADAHRGLFHLTLSPKGEPLSEPELFSLPGWEVKSYDLAGDLDDTLHIFWSGEDEDGPRLFYLRLEGGVASGSEPLVPGGMEPAAQIDRDGHLHLVWIEEGERDEEPIYAVTFPGAMVIPTRGVKLLDMQSGTRGVRSGPVLGLDSRYGYLIWTIEHRTGLAAGTVEGWYAVFPLEKPQPTTSRSFRLPALEKPIYAEYESPYGYHHLMLLSAHLPSASDLIDMPATIGTQGEELPVAFRLNVNYGYDRKFQIAMAVFKGGRLVGYQLAGKSGYHSSRPTLLADDKGNLHLAWIDSTAGGSTHLYYASTSPLVKAHLDRLTEEDLLSGAAKMIFGSILGLLLAVLIPLWLAPALIWGFVCTAVIRFDDLGTRRGKIGLALALLIYLVTKLLMLPSLFSYIPFSAWLPLLPSGLSPLLMVGTPLFVSGGAAAIAIWFLRRVESRELLAALLAFALPDAFLTLIVYSPSILGMAW
ncbi:MAG: hypothetical protein ACE5II_06810, partial [Anaerolineae bacterium]